MTGKRSCFTQVDKQSESEVGTRQPPAPSTTTNSAFCLCFESLLLSSA
ncbi:Uncharacterised protein [Vibrio cholerae]|nr:Uncharacterised protein [Vibrio cholerae]CSI50143.1 Uncharacterised protein [Vibrio cholerae]